MRNKRHIALTLLLLLLVTMTAAAEDSLRLRSCRPRTEMQVLQGRRAAHRAYDRDSYTGDRRQLVVLVSFREQRFKEADPLPLWQRVFNEEGLSEGSFRGSLHDYFLAQSGGRFRLTFDLHYVHSDVSRAKYRSTAADDANSEYLVRDLVDTLRTRDIDWSPYDWNGDGYVDQIIIIYAGKGQNAGGGSDTIWPHQWWLSQHAGGQPLTVTSGGVDYLVDSYCCVQELYSNNSYGTFGTLCHEYTHCFGFPDLYYGSTSCVYTWDLMDFGNNNGGGFCPPNYSALERMLMGWLTPVELTTPTSVSNMEPGEAYLVRNDGWADEYYLVENRQLEGWDAALPGSGVVIAHVDYDKELWEGIDGIVNNPLHERYTIFAANGNTSKYQAVGWAYPYAGNDQLTNTSRPAASLLNENSDGTLLMSKPITAIAVQGRLASFDFMKEEPSGISVPTTAPTATAVYTLQGRRVSGDLSSQPRGVYIVVGADGTTRKKVNK